MAASRRTSTMKTTRVVAAFAALLLSIHVNVAAGAEESSTVTNVRDPRRDLQDDRPRPQAGLLPRRQNHECDLLIQEIEDVDPSKKRTVAACQLDPRDADGVSGITVRIDGLDVSDETGHLVDEDGDKIRSGRVKMMPQALEVNPATGRAEMRTGVRPTFQKKRNVGMGDNGMGDNGMGLGRGDRNRNLAVVTGDKPILVVHVTDGDGVSTTSSAAEISDEVFGTHGDPINLKSMYHDCSHGKVNVIPADNRPPPYNVVDGVVEVTIPDVASGKDDGVIRNAVTTALTTKLGHALPGNYSQVMYCLPPGTDGSWIAYAYIDSWNSVYNDDWCNYPSAQMHEIGHNLNLAHANHAAEGGTYDDQSGMMGYSYDEDDGPLQCFNGAKSWQLGWYADRNHTLDPVKDGAWCGLMKGIADYDDSEGFTVILKINTASDEDYYVSFNRQAGVNSGTKEGGNQVMVVTQGDEGEDYAYSNLEAKMGEGDVYTIYDFSQTVDVTVESINLVTGIASVKVAVQGETCSFVKCGNGVVGNGICPTDGDCCSADGECGTSASHCADYCGGGDVRNGLCPFVDECCTPDGYCGTGPDYCFPPLEDIGDCSSSSTCGNCQGDCDHDGHCSPGLVCADRSGGEDVPGCNGNDGSGTDYCYEESRAPANQLKHVGDGPYPLGECEGDCDYDSHCAPGLLCYQRSSTQDVPGCVGMGISGKDYCYNPNPTTDPPTEAPTQSPTRAPSPTTSVGQDGEVTVIPKADAFVRGGAHETTNYGSDANLVVKQDSDSDFERTAVLDFDLSSQEAVAMLSSGSAIAATLRLYVTGVASDTTRTLTVSRLVNSAWDEATVTWSNLSPVVDMIGLSFDVTEQEAWVEVDVSELCTSLPQGNNGKLTLLLENVGTLSAGSYCSFQSREGGSATATTPQLVLSDVADTLAPTALPTGGPTRNPSRSPTASPTSSSPTTSPTVGPTSSPTKTTTVSPTSSPTASPTTRAPTPGLPISSSPTTLSPTLNPSNSPTRSPVTSYPTSYCGYQLELGLTTGFTSAGESSETQGIFFDVKVTSPETIFINAFDINIEKSDPEVEVFTRPGTHDGHTGSADGWTYLGRHTLAGSGENRPTRLPLSTIVPVEPGAKQAFYLSQRDNDDIQTQYVSGADVDTDQASDDNLRVFFGTRKNNDNVGFPAKPFNEGLSPGGGYLGYGFSGTVKYSKCRTSNNCDLDVGVSTGFEGGGGGYTDEDIETTGLFFDVEATSTMEELFINAFDLNIEKSSPRVRVFTRQGSHVTHEDSIDGWTDLGTYRLDGQQQGNPTRLTLSGSVALPPPGTRQAFYLNQVNNDDIQTQYLPGTNADTEHASDENLKIYVGTRKDNNTEFAAFNAANPNVQGFGFSGTLLYSSCGGGTPAPTPTPSKSPTTSSPTLSCGYQLEQGICTGFTAGGDGKSSESSETQGVFFDVEVTSSKTIYINAFDINIEKDSPQVQVFTRPGTHFGYTGSADGWTDLGSYQLAANGEGHPSRIELTTTVPVEPGMKQAFYLSQLDNDDIQTQYATGIDTNTEQAFDDNLRLYFGTRKNNDNDGWPALPFDEGLNPGSESLGYGFSGTVRYGECKPGNNCDLDAVLTTGFQAGGGDYSAEDIETTGIFFDVEATSSTEELFVNAIDLNVEKDSPVVRVFTRSGSHVTHEDSIDGWTDLGTYTLNGQQEGNPTTLTLSASVALPPPGSRQAFYVSQYDNDDVQTQYIPDSTADTEHVSDDHLKIYVGTRKDHSSYSDPFDPAIVNAQGFGFSGNLHYVTCGGTPNPTPSPTTASPTSTSAPTWASQCSGPITYVPGDLTVTQHGLSMSTGLTAKIVATRGLSVQYSDGSSSTRSFHAMPDGAAVINGTDGSYAYVSNSEVSSDNGGVGAIIFNQDGSVKEYKWLLSDTTRNCGGGKTPWGTWVSAEEDSSTGSLWETDPFGTMFDGGTSTYQETTMAFSTAGQFNPDAFESVAFDNRDPNNLVFFVTIDSSDGDLRRFKPDTNVVSDAIQSGDYSQVLSSAGTVDYLVLNPNTSSGGTYSWTTNKAEGMASASSHFRNCEGIEFNEKDGKLWFVSKTQHELFALDLDDNTYENFSTNAFPGQPDQLKLICALGDDELLYFAEDGGDCGIYARTSDGEFMEVIKGVGYSGDETSGVAFSPDRMRMYFAVQDAGHIMEISRDDGCAFSGEWKSLSEGAQQAATGRLSGAKSNFVLPQLLTQTSASQDASSTDVEE